jgi:ATP-dependent 26S proteasome regulatory subunit
VVEPALSSRPGRIDLAVKMPLPDEEGRARLLDLYGKGLELDLTDKGGFIASTAGVTPAFIREVLRRAALYAAERGDGNSISGELLANAVAELREGADEVTNALLGASPMPIDQT